MFIEPTLQPAIWPVIREVSRRLDILERRPKDLVIIICTSSTRPPNAEGLAIYETDTSRFLVNNGSTWIDPKNFLADKGAATATKFAHGADSISVTTAVSQNTKAVSFGVTFAAVPDVFLTMQDSTFRNVIRVNSGSKTITGFTVNVATPDATNWPSNQTLDFAWWAVGT